jgi:hypothetical protein
LYAAIVSPQIVGTKNLAVAGERWFATDTTQSRSYTTSNTVDPTRQSFQHYVDVVMAPNNPNTTYAPGGARIVAGRVDGIVPIGPFIEVGGGLIRGASNSLQLGDTTGSVTSVWGKITNSDTSNQPVWFDDLEGLLFTSNGTTRLNMTVGGGETTLFTHTIINEQYDLRPLGYIVNPLLDVNATGLPVRVRDEDGFVVYDADANTTRVFQAHGSNRTITAYGTGGVASFHVAADGTTTVYRTSTGLPLFRVNAVTGDTTAFGDFFATGNINAGGSVTATGSCCTSDARAKTNVTVASTESAFRRIMGLVTKEFTYTHEYQRSDPSVKNVSYVGLIAQEVEKDFGYMVTKIKRTVGNVVHHDFHVISPQLLYGEIIGALQHLNKLHDAVKSRLADAEHEIAVLKASDPLKDLRRAAVPFIQNAGQAVSDRLHRIERFLEASIGSDWVQQMEVNQAKKGK